MKDSRTQQPLDFMPKAAAKVLELMREEANPALKLRVYVTGGGCSGFQYGFAFEESVNEDDTVVVGDPRAEEGIEVGEDAQAVTLLVDPVSFQYLQGAQIDYQEDIEGARFIIRNPNAVTTCGCGSSFSID